MSWYSYISHSSRLAIIEYRLTAGLDDDVRVWLRRVCTQHCASRATSTTGLSVCLSVHTSSLHYVVGTNFNVGVLISDHALIRFKLNAKIGHQGQRTDCHQQSMAPAVTRCFWSWSGSVKAVFWLGQAHGHVCRWLGQAVSRCNDWTTRSPLSSRHCSSPCQTSDLWHRGSSPCQTSDTVVRRGLSRCSAPCESRREQISKTATTPRRRQAGLEDEVLVIWGHRPI